MDVLRLRWLLVAIFVTGCIPDVEVDESLVTEPRIVALRSEPAEAKPGAAVQWTALVVAPVDASNSTISWSLCKARKSLSETGPVSKACFSDDAANVVALGIGSSITGSLSRDGCRLFGPDPPVAKPGEPAGRPIDPDSTGGYYQPIVMRTDVPTLGQTRLTCGVAGATQEQSAEFVSRYRPNENPAIESLKLGEVAVPVAGEGTVPSVKAGSSHRLTVTWPDCTSATERCAGAEPYIVFSPSALHIEERRESMHLAWYITGGSLMSARGGVAESEAIRHSLDNEWTAPTTAGEVSLWAVLIDDRGGAGWQRFVIRVEN